MVLSPIIYFFFSCFFLVTAGGSNFFRSSRSSGAEWGYQLDNGPDSWEGTCHTGRKQSPINLRLGSVIAKNFLPFKFDDDYVNKQSFRAKNNGHTILVTLKNDTVKPVVYGGGLGGRFIFEQLHMHWESEHEFEGKRASMEMHMVHYNSKYTNFKEAAKMSDGVVVLAILFDESTETSNVVESFFKHILEEVFASKDLSSFPDNAAFPGNSIDGMLDNHEDLETFSLRELLPENICRFFRYDGSLTTPGCDEVVQWTVFMNRFPISKRVLESLRNLQDHEFHFLQNNFRPVQPLNGREVYAQFTNYDEDAENECSQPRNSGNNGNKIFSIFILSTCLLTHLRILIY